MDTRNYERQKNTGKNMKLWIILFSFFLTIFMGAMELPKIVKAAEPTISVKEINYLNSTITLQLNSRDTQVFYSNSQKKTWDIVEGKINSDNTITMDISWITPSSNYVITFKGNYSTGIATVVIPKQATNFRATYNKAQSTVSFSNEGTRTVQWRKKGSSTWKTVDVNTIAKEMSYLYTNGATVVFRLAPTNGTSATDYGFRASNEATVIITKKTAAPSITVNGSRFLIAAKKGMAYRTVNSDGTETDWTSVGGTANLMLTDIAPQVMYSADSTEQKEITLQFRASATSSSQISKIATIMVPVQEGPPNEDKYGISLKYTSSSTLALQVKAATSTMPFEYTVVKEGFDLDYQTAVWTPITANTAVSISKTQAPKGSHIYLRKKSTDASAGAAFTLASAEIDVTGGNGVLYPDAMVASSVTTLITTSGVCKIDNSSAYLTFTLYSPVETTVSAIDFYDSYGNKRGTVTSKSTVSANSKSTGVNDKYIITTKITSTESINNVTKEVLYAYITLANSEVIRSSQEAGILLYLYPNSKLNNPSEDNYTNDFKRIYESTDSSDASQFKFRLVLGTEKVIDPSEIEKYTTDATAISSITYSGYKLDKDTDYTVEYGSYIDENGNTVPTATVTVNVAEIEKASAITVMDQAVPLKIYLNNNEVLDNAVKITLVSTAKIDNVPIAWSIMEGSLKETQTSTITDSDGNKTTITEEVITYIITMSIFDNSYGVSVSDVTWGGISVFGSANVSGGMATINLSNAKINKLTTDSTDTKNLVITLSNGFTINTGCKLTIINAND